MTLSGFEMIYFKSMEKLVINSANEELVAKESLEKSKFEGLLTQDDFFKEIEGVDEANSFRVFLSAKFNFLNNNEKTAEQNYERNPLLKEYRDLQNKSYIIDKFMYNEFEFEPGSKEWKEEEKKIDDLNQKAEKILEDDPGLKRLAQELGDKWNQATKEKNDFLRDTKAFDKTRIINQVLIPYFNQEKKVDYLSKNGKEELQKTRDALYEKLEQHPDDEIIEKEIKEVEWNLQYFDADLQRETNKFERMKDRISSDARSIYSSISP